MKTKVIIDWKDLLDLGWEGFNNRLYNEVPDGNVPITITNIDMVGVSDEDLIFEIEYEEKNKNEYF